MSGGEGPGRDRPAPGDRDPVARPGRGRHRRKPAGPPLVTDPPDEARASRAERLVAALFVLAFLAGCGFIAAYIGLEVGSSNLPPGARTLSTPRSGRTWRSAWRCRWSCWRSAPGR